MYKNERTSSIGIIYVYAATSGNSDEEMEKFYEEVNIPLAKSV